MYLVLENVFKWFKSAKQRSRTASRLWITWSDSEMVDTVSHLWIPVHLQLINPMSLIEIIIVETTDWNNICCCLEKIYPICLLKVLWRGCTVRGLQRRCFVVVVAKRLRSKQWDVWPEGDERTILLHLSIIEPASPSVSGTVQQPEHTDTSQWILN